MMAFVLVFTALVAALLVGFIVIARKGRDLRRNKLLPPRSSVAFVQTGRGDKHMVQPEAYFYIGKNPASDIVLTGANEEYEICIFYHRKRFAFQTPSGKPGIRINGEEQLAGYLQDGDVLTIADQSFTFHTF